MWSPAKGTQNNQPSDMLFLKSREKKSLKMSSWRWVWMPQLQLPGLCLTAHTNSEMTCKYQHTPFYQNKENKLILWKHAGKEMRCIDPHAVLWMVLGLVAFKSLFFANSTPKDHRNEEWKHSFHFPGCLAHRAAGWRFTTTDRLEQRRGWCSSTGSNAAYSNNV